VRGPAESRGGGNRTNRVRQAVKSVYAVNTPAALFDLRR
jgi:hypothetical protein